MQRVYTPSCGREFQTLCCHSRTNNNWTCSSSSFFKFFGNYGIEIQIPSTTMKDRNSWVVVCRGKNRLTIAKESELCATELEQSRIEETHARQSKNSRESSVVPKRSYSCWRKEVEWCSCLQIIQWRIAFSQNLQIGHEIGTSLWSRWKRNWRRFSLEFDGTKTAKCVPEAWK